MTSFDEALAEAVDRAAKDLRRQFEIFRPTVIAAIDETVTPTKFTLSSGRRMTSTYSGELAVGDKVVYVEQPDGFVVGKFAGT